MKLINVSTKQAEIQYRRTLSTEARIELFDKLVNIVQLEANHIPLIESFLINNCKICEPNKWAIFGYHRDQQIIAVSTYSVGKIKCAQQAHFLQEMGMQVIVFKYSKRNGFMAQPTI
jgi:hypothetical protein